MIPMLCSSFLFGFSQEILRNPALRIPCPPFITGDAFRAHCDFVFDETNDRLNPEQIPDLSTIFVGPYVLADFFKYYHPRIQGRYILVTHNTDNEAPGPFARYLEDENLIAWFSQNVEKVSHPKLFPIPIGLGNRYTPHADLSLVDKMAKLPEPESREIFAYLLQARTNRDERNYVCSLFRKKKYVTHISSWRNFDQYLNDLKHAKFSFVVRGAGIDCHRTWEALYMGAIPILKSSTSDEMYENLPVLIVKEWTDINETFLSEAYKKIKSQPQNLYKLNIQYWLDLIDQTKQMGAALKKSNV
jgi:hypothetical protein